MKAILEFNLPEDVDGHQDAINGTRWKIVVSELDNALRDKLKYGNLPSPVHKALREIREHLNNLCTDNNLNIHQ